MNTNDLIIKLGENLKTLTDTYTNCISTKNYNEGLNVMKNIDMVVKQLKELDFQTMASKYGSYDSVTGEETRELAIWKQNGFGQIKDHEVFKIESGGNWCTASSVNSIKVKNHWYDILKFFVENKIPQLIELDYSNHENELKHRGTGKTSAIVRLSNDYNIPIYTNKPYYNVGLIDRNKEFNLNAIIVDDISKLNMSQYNKGILLVDEVTNISKIDTNHFTIIGFTQGFKE